MRRLLAPLALAVLVTAPPAAARERSEIRALVRIAQETSGLRARTLVRVRTERAAASAARRTRALDRAYPPAAQAHDETVFRASGLPAPYHFVPSVVRDRAVSLADLVSSWPVVLLAARCDEGLVRRLDALDARTFLLRAGVRPSFIAQWRAMFSIMTMASSTRMPIENIRANRLTRLMV